MTSVLLKLTVTILLVLFWVFVTAQSLKYCINVWRVRKVDTRVALRLFKSAVRDALPKNPLSAFVEGVREERTPRVTLKTVDGLPLPLTDGATLTVESMKNRRQYRLTIVNDTPDVLRQMTWRFQLPYRMESISVVRAEGTIDAKVIGEEPWIASGNVIVHGKPMSRVHVLSVAELSPKGIVELMLVLNTRDEAKFSPDLTFIFGQYTAVIQKETFPREFYSALSVQADGTVVMDPTASRPAKLVKIIVDTF
jgi:hypothetical protein